MMLLAAIIVRIGVLGLFAPDTLVVRPAPGCALVVEQNGQRTVLEGGQSIVARGALRAWPRGGCDFILAVPGKIERRYRGDLEIRQSGGVLSAVISMDLETAVASAVAAESPPGAPLTALMAQAVTTRSYYIAARGRHEGFDFCDTTHCQFLRSPPEPDSPAAVAARRTRGLVLTWRGAPIPALFSASCGGRTRALANPGVDEYPYYEVECPYCRRGPRVSCSYCDPGAAGAGHGFGLCQTGAKGMAAAGATLLEILGRYFPNAQLGSPLP
ncbi:MAG TPA: SpoIID/LytB domain-containing protein [Bryobacteraceae bacterium]|nr:SpoIID/LytB domain-containing protein [Bryobacteraceae bacterium]HOQ46797.1 SpoIID/LytB domain-containing protein [Bryobacteraceae bacterium]HPQ15828.1 SpoIID/LytB domain-containing protein [Bryobacteraceae bacterium]HPU73587.1 SpoIID/LytB domain-containing protein [Bryobacteraceae bacterium]